MPERIQLRRIKGWRKPENTVVVARPTKWGNPINWRDMAEREVLDDAPGGDVSDEARRWYAVTALTRVIKHEDTDLLYPAVEEIRDQLGGKNLACWCPLDQPCHADVLLNIANQG